MSDKEDIILFSTADWDNPFWTNKQHMANELAESGHRVFYIESVGLRAPTSKGSDLTRIMRRLKRSFSKPKRVKHNIYVWSPFTIPFRKVPLVNRLNKLIFRKSLSLQLDRLKFSVNFLWTYNPLTSIYFNLKSFKTVVYHCVDEVKSQPGMNVELIEAAEDELNRNASFLFVTSNTLYESRKILNRNTYYFPNVVDYNHFSSATDSVTELPEDLAAISGTRIGFVGAISKYKIDFELLKEVALELSEFSFVLIGKVGEGEPGTKTDFLSNVPNIYFLGPKDYNDLPSYLKGFDAAILPSNINEYTDSMFPMKFFEYLAAGLPIISTKLKSLEEFADICFLLEKPKDFARSIELAVSNNSNEKVKERQAVARKYTYRERTKFMFEIINKI